MSDLGFRRGLSDKAQKDSEADFLDLSSAGKFFARFFQLRKVLPR
jgi:hypothetical protein